MIDEATLQLSDIAVNLNKQIGANIQDYTSVTTKVLENGDYSITLKLGSKRKGTYRQYHWRINQNDHESVNHLKEGQSINDFIVEKIKSELKDKEKEQAQIIKRKANASRRYKEKTSASS